MTMRDIKRTSAFRRDYRREMRGRYRSTLASELQRVVALLAADEPLPLRYRDHALAGNWEGYRDCHFRFDLVMAYRKIGDDLLELTRLGSHSEIGL